MANGIAVNVAVRVRPLMPHEDTDVIKYMHEDPQVLVVQDRRNVFAFDHIFSNNIHQCEVYNTIIKPLVSHVLDGHNCTILAYGQTGTGKTYTMGTDSEKYLQTDAGLIPRVLDDFLEISASDSDIQISISFIEIYNEKVFDLLTANKAALIVKRFSVHGNICESIENSEDARNFLLKGGRNRHVRHTTLNASSSRSHAVFTVYYKKMSTGCISKLHLVDLAGSEGVRRTGNQGRAFKEGVTINKGLLAIGRVISALSDKHNSVIPYRDSMLTTILRDSLNSDKYVSLLACVSPSDSDISETLATLRFAVEAKAVRSKPQLEHIVAEYDKCNPGVLGAIPPTTVKKKRKMPAIFSSSHVKRPGNINSITDSPTYTTMDSLSVSASTMYSNIEVPQPAFSFSPLVRKYTEALQTTVLEQISSMLQNHFTPAPAPKSNNENTPPLPYDSVEDRVAQISRNELSQLTVVNNVNINQSVVHISPLTKKLDFDCSSPLASQLELSSEKSPFKQAEDVFKVPKRIAKNLTTKSPKKVNPRRSVRLSMQRLSSINAPTPAPRLSMINRTKPKTIVTQFLATENDYAPRRRSIRLKLQFPASPVSTPAPTPRIRKNKTPPARPTPAPRKYEMIQGKRTSPRLDFAIPNAKSPRSAIRKHRDQILRLLNRGTQKEIQALPTIGVKTALQIYTYRNLNGQFKNYEDLKRMTVWRGKGFDRFMQANQLN